MNVLTVLKIIGIVLASVIAIVLLFILIASFIPVRVFFSKRENEDLSLYIKILFYKLKLLPKKPEDEQKEEKTKQQKSGEEKEEKKEKKPVFETAKTVIDLLKASLGRVLWLIKHIRIDKLYLCAICADEDPSAAALDYGRTCALLYPALGYVRANAKYSEKDMDVAIRCDFDRTDSVFELDLALHLRIGYALIAAVCAFFKYLKIRLAKD